MPEYSEEEVRHAQKNQEIADALGGAIAPWGQLVSLLGINNHKSQTHIATEETIILLKKIKDFWGFVEASLQEIGPGSLH